MLVIVMLVVTACGRLGFEALGDGSGTDGTRSDGPAGGGPRATSCETLAATCGPAGTSPCCESPVVTGGTVLRSYDVASDGMYPDMSYPATVSSFRLDKYEVTVGRFRAFVAAGQGTQANPPLVGAGARTLNGMASQGGWDPNWNTGLDATTTDLVTAVQCDPMYQTWTDTLAGNENRPMNCISWYEAMAFCVWDGGYLPTEAEWNYAAAGGVEQRAYPWSTPPASLGIDGTRASYYDGVNCLGDGMSGCALTDLVAVGSKPAGDGVWGQSDLGGNVWEWVLDWYASPYATPCNDCANLTEASDRVLRGGGFQAGAAPGLRGAHRINLPPTIHDFNFGVRCSRMP